MEGQEMNSSDTPPPSNDTSYFDWLAAQSSQASLTEDPLPPPKQNSTDEPLVELEEDKVLNNTSQPAILQLPTKKNDTDPLEEWVLEFGDKEEEESSVNNTSSLLPIVESLTNEHNDTDTDSIIVSETNDPSTAPSSLSSDSINTYLPSNSPSYHSTIASTLTTSSAPSSIPSFDNTNPPTYRRNQVLGCSPMHYKLYNEQQLRNNASDSLLKLYMEEILPNTFLKLAKKHDLHSANPIVIQYINGDDDDDLFIRKDGTLYGGVITTNDIYELIPQDDMFVPLGHSIKGDQITQIIDSMNDNGGHDRDSRVLVENYMLVEEGDEDASYNNIVGYAVEKKPAQIKDSSKYTLYTVSNNEYAVSSIMESLDIPIVTSLPPDQSEYLITNKSVRSIWIDYVKMEWPYDGNDCEGFGQDNDGDDLASTSSGGGSSGVSSTTATSSSSPNKEHGGKTVHHHDAYADIATGKDGSVQSPSPRGSSMASQSGTSSHANSAMSILLILTAMGAIIFFVIKARRPGREKQSWETTISRQSELGGSSNNDLELQVEDDKPDAAAGSYGPPTGGYSSPAIGTFI